jgi:hypothetical protein
MPHVLQELDGGGGEAVSLVSGRVLWITCLHGAAFEWHGSPGRIFGISTQYPGPALRTLFTWPVPEGPFCVALGSIVNLVGSAIWKHLLRLLELCIKQRGGIVALGLCLFKVFGLGAPSGL